MTTTVPAFDDTAFRNMFPQFENSTLFPTDQLDGWWTMGNAYINIDNNYPWNFKFKQLQLAADLMCAHLAASFSLINSGIPSSVIQSTSEGSVSVSLVPPVYRSAFGYWLSTTPYGTQLRALLRTVANVGLFVGGSYENSGFRRAGGLFV
jgi:hypothetical protein